MPENPDQPSTATAHVSGHHQLELDEPWTIPRVNAVLPIGRDGKPQSRPGRLTVHPSALIFTYKALLSSVQYTIPVRQIVSITVDRGMAANRLVLSLVSGHSATFRLPSAAATQVADHVRAAQLGT